MKNFFRILTGSRSNTPGPDVVASFEAAFGAPLNVEWHKHGNLIEAIFYMDETEHIARFDRKGNLAEFQKNLSLLSWPEKIKSAALTQGEIMSMVFMKKGTAVSYEVIIRDNALKRFLLLLDEKGSILKKEEL